MPKLVIDGREIEVPAGVTVLQACEAAGVEVPRFCYHERLSIAGNCRMCLVEMEKSPKPSASCAMPAADGMVIRTDSPMAKKARKGVMEFLLINHPLDCPICDQGGECDLQDQAMAYGFDRSRYIENKRAVEDKEFGPLVKTSMTRCIHCTRCIRFATEVAGVEDLGATGRGEHMEVGTYVEKALASEMSGNIIDLCPVGALTSKPYAFTARPWELRKTESVDVMDAVGSNIRIDARGNEVMRVLPRLHEDINEEWISDKTRFACDGLKRQRLDRPYVRRNGKLVEATWPEAFSAIAEALKGKSGESIAAIIGDQCDAEAMVVLKDLVAQLGSPNVDCRQDRAKLDASCRAGYVFNTTIAGIETADVALLIGTDPRREAAIVNTRLRKRHRMGGFAVGVIGPHNDLTYKYDYLGGGGQTLVELANGRHGFAERLKAARRPMLILGQGALARPDGAAVLGVARKLAESFGMVRGSDHAAGAWNGFNVLHTAAARVGGLDLGLVPGPKGRDVAGILDGAEAGDIKVVYLLAADEINTKRLGEAFVIYQGHHGDSGAQRADVILPGAAYPEKNGTYVNTEGRVQHGYAAISPPGDAREDWKILRALSERLGFKPAYNSLKQVRARLSEISPTFGRPDAIVPSAWGPFGQAQSQVQTQPFLSTVVNFYMTDPIGRASVTMAKCTQAFVLKPAGKTGTDG